MLKKYQILALALSILLLLLIACASKSPVQQIPPSEPGRAMPTAGAKPDWQTAWEKTLAEAQKEGKVTIMTNSGDTVRASLSRGLKEKYGITTEWVVSGRGAELVAKVTNERKAGIYLIDIFLSGSSTMVTQLKPYGYLDQIPPMFILPEVKDTSLWYANQHFVDKGKYIFPFLAYVFPPIFINSDIFRAEDLKSYRDLLKPAAKGKIVLADPTTPSAALRWFTVVGEKIMGREFSRELARQDITILRDERLSVDWVAKGKYAIVIGVRPDPVTEFRNAGAPLKLVIPQEGTWLTGGPAVLSILNRQPHPNATKVFINWLLSKEGQLAYTKANGVQSGRLDIDTSFLDPQILRKPDVPYFMSENEEFLMKDPEHLELARQIFGHLLR